MGEGKEVNAESLSGEDRVEGGGEAGEEGSEQGGDLVRREEALGKFGEGEEG